MKIGFNMLLWTTVVTEEHRSILAALKTAGYDGVEIPGFDGTPAGYAALGRMLEDIGLERTAITVIPSPDQNPISADAAVRQRGDDYLAWCLECAEALGARILCGPIHQSLGVFSGASRTADELDRVLAFHRRLGPVAASHGVTVAVEALNRFECYLITTMAELAAQLDAVGHPNISGMYDTFHANIEEKDPVGAITAHIGHIAHVHISENDRGTPGRGHVNWPATFRALKAGGYDGWLTIEAFGRALPELAAATRVWRDFFPSPDEVWRDGFKHIQSGWAAA
jgi:D-psicose/D-tagatose/L-ribulose 3-epimerase